jgi:hypothetical protein
MARCSKFSCVWNSASPMASSTRMQPQLHMSQGYDQPRPKITCARWSQHWVQESFLHNSVIDAT